MKISNTFNHTQYTTFADQYLQSNQDGSIGGMTPDSRVKELERYLPKGRKIFEIGSGGGLDAIALKNAGYEVVWSDFVQPFVEKLQAELLNTILFDAKNDEFPLDTVDAIYANAVFVHFTPEEIVEFLKKVKFHLQNEKIIFISVIQGRGTERTGRSRGFDRDFQYYDKSTLTEIIGQAGYIILWDNFTDEKWIQIIATVA